jgi:hypothetical protein
MQPAQKTARLISNVGAACGVANAAFPLAGPCPSRRGIGVRPNKPIDFSWIMLNPEGIWSLKIPFLPSKKGF